MVHCVVASIRLLSCTVAGLGEVARLFLTCTLKFQKKKKKTVGGQSQWAEMSNRGREVKVMNSSNTVMGNNIIIIVYDGDKPTRNGCVH